MIAAILILLILRCLLHILSILQVPIDDDSIFPPSQHLPSAITFHSKAPFPASVREEEFELLAHPLERLLLRVPRFFSKGWLHAPTPAMASALGLYRLEDASFAGDPSERTVYVMGGRRSLESAFANASFPLRVRAGAVAAEFAPFCPGALCEVSRAVDAYELPAELAGGRLLESHLLGRMYRGEYYVLRLGRGALEEGWDVNLVEEWESKGNEMAVLTERVCSAEGLEPFFSSDFFFARGHFPLSVPFDPRAPLDPADPTSKTAEDASMTIRAFTHGYDFYAADRSPPPLPPTLLPRDAFLG